MTRSASSRPMITFMSSKTKRSRLSEAMGWNYCITGQLPVCCDTLSEEMASHLMSSDSITSPVHEGNLLDKLISAWKLARWDNP